MRLASTRSRKSKSFVIAFTDRLLGRMRYRTSYYTIGFNPLLNADSASHKGASVVKNAVANESAGGTMAEILAMLARKIVGEPRVTSASSRVSLPDRRNR